MTKRRSRGAAPDRPPKLRLGEVREARRLSIADLASRSGCAKAAIVRYERGEAWPNDAELERLAGALDVPVGALLASGEGDERPSG